MQSYWSAYQQDNHTAIEAKADSIPYFPQEGSGDFKVVTNKMIWENMDELVNVGAYNLTWRYFKDLRDYLFGNVLGWKKKRRDYIECLEEQLGTPWRGD